MRLSTILKKCLHNKNFIIGLCMVGLMVLLMVVGFFYMPYDPDVMDTENELQFFSAAHPLGAHVGYCQVGSVDESAGIRCLSL